MSVRVVDQAETYRLLRDDDLDRWAVVEVRCRHVYSLDPHHSRTALDTLEGMAAVVGEDGWCCEDVARRCFEAAVKGERYYSQIIW